MAMALDAGPPPAPRSGVTPGRDRPRGSIRETLRAAARRCPLCAVFLIIILSNAVGSFFNIHYNHHLIVEYNLTDAQREAFWRVLIPAYNLVAYPIGFGLILWLFAPAALALRRIRRGGTIEPRRLERLRRRQSRRASARRTRMDVGHGDSLPGRARRARMPGVSR